MPAKKKAPEPQRIPIRLPWADLMAFGKALKNSFSANMLGDVTLVFTKGMLSINSEWGGTTMNYEGDFDGVVVVKGGAFKTLIGAHTKSNPAAPWIVGGVDRELGEFALANAGVKARFLS